MSTVNQTFSLPADVEKNLHKLIKKRLMSHFVTESIRKRLKGKNGELLKEYALATKDEGQKEASRDWEATISDGV